MGWCRCGYSLRVPVGPSWMLKKKRIDWICHIHPAICAWVPPFLLRCALLITLRWMRCYAAILRRPPPLLVRLVPDSWWTGHCLRCGMAFADERRRATAKRWEDQACGCAGAGQRLADAELLRRNAANLLFSLCRTACYLTMGDAHGVLGGGDGAGRG